MISDINLQLEVIEKSIAWSKDFKRDTFPVEEMKEYRRSLKRIANSLSVNCSAAAYGESQVGKSYLMSSLLSSPDSPFVITNDGKEYSFIDDLNPSGGNNSKTESTGVITRFTIRCDNEAMRDFVKIRNLSIADLLMLLVDSYYNDLKIDGSKVLLHDAINTELESIKFLWANKTSEVQDVLTEDDIKDVCDYLFQVIGSSAVNITRSDFKKIIASKIKFVHIENWVNIFELLWNKNKEFNNLFGLLVSEYKKIGFQTEIYVPFEAVLREKGTLLKIEWLDSVCGYKHESLTDILTTDVYSSQGRLLASGFSKSILSALIAELTFVVPEQVSVERSFLKKIDLLDFPGARSREKFKEQEIGSVLPTVLRRGKVAYLFNKYSRSRLISSVLFCHHNDQKNESTLGVTINDWIETNIGRTPEERTSNLQHTNGISPFFLVATKFNIELERTKNDTSLNVELLGDHWKRFRTVLPEIIKPSTWFEKWVVRNATFRSEFFQGIYLLRDFYWSMKNQVFDGYDDRTKSPEICRHIHQDYSDYFENLEQSFLSNEFVLKHFQDPKKSWDEVSGLNSDGSKAIIRDLDAISNLLDLARHQKFQKELRSLREEILTKLMPYYEPENKEDNNLRIRSIVGSIRRTLDLCIGTKPETFGFIIDQLMIPVGELRKIAYDIVILKTETPKDFDEIILIRTQAGIIPSDDRQVNIQKLSDYYACDVVILDKAFKEKGFTVEDVISSESNVATTIADVLAKSILDFWISFINRQVKGLEKYLPHSDEVAFMLQTLSKKLRIKTIISEKIDKYSRVFSDHDLPNAIADFASLTLNNFVSTIGRTYLEDRDISAIREKAQSCNIIIDLSPEKSDVKKSQISVLEALKAFDDASDHNSVSIQTLMKLPFWDNFQRWKNLLVIGLLYASDVSQVDPLANAAMKDIIDNCNNLFQS